MELWEVLEIFEQQVDNMRIYKDTNRVLGFEVEYDNEGNWTKQLILSRP